MRNLLLPFLLAGKLLGCAYTATYWVSYSLPKAGDADSGTVKA